MRTTVDIDDNVLRVAKALARDEQVSLGTILSRLARRGLAGGEIRARPSGFPVFEAAANAAPLDLDLVNDARDDD